MKLKFTIPYVTQWGEALHVALCYHSQDGTQRTQNLLMQTQDGQLWTLETAVVESRQHPVSAITYCYQVEDGDGRVLRREWAQVPRTYWFDSSKNYVFDDQWRDLPLCAHLYSNAVETTRMAPHGEQVEARRLPLYRRTALFRVSAPQLEAGQSLALLGSHPAMGSWSTARYLRMEYIGRHEWMLSVNLDAVQNTHVHETTDHSITLSWDQVDKAAGYHVFQKKDDSDNYLQIATTEDLYYIVYDLEQATPYSFYVKAFNGNNESQDFTPLENVWTLPQKEEITQISSKSSGVIHLEWTPNSKADGYLVEFHTVGKPYRDENKNVIESGDITSFDITELIPQVNIGVRVTAYFNRDDEQVMGTPSEEKTVRVSGIAAQPADSGSSGSSDSGSTEESSESSESSESGDGDTEQPNDWSDYGDYGDGDYNYVDQGDYYTDEYNYY